jgi:hypothetical protein
VTVTSASPVKQPTFIRGPRKTDQSFIASTWIRQLGARGARGGDVGRLVDQVMDRTDTRALIRHAPGDQDSIRGWVVYAYGYGVPLVHFVYVRKDYREKGYAAALLDHVGILRTTSFVHTAANAPPSASRLLRSYKGAALLPLTEFLGAP